MGMDQSLPDAAAAPLASSLTRLIESHKSRTGQEEEEESPYQNLALQVLHNLQYQHQWTNLEIHRSTTKNSLETRLSRPLLSGISPKRLYLHPDEQIEIITQERERRANRANVETSPEGGSNIEAEALQPEGEWVLPTHLREEWTLERFAEIFDMIEAVPPGYEDRVKIKWRSTKRVLLAIVQDDSTIVYYFMHDGLVKPRQN
jgi:tRNA-splicing endonuclease subunit Sen15, fungi type